MKEWMWIVEEDNSGTLPKKEDCRKWKFCSETLLFKDCLTYTPTSQFSSISYFKKERSIEVCVRFQTYFSSQIQEKYIILSDSFFLTYSISYSMFFSILHFLFTLLKILFSIYTYAVYLVIFLLCLLEFRSWVCLSIFYILLVVDSILKIVWNKVHFMSTLVNLSYFHLFDVRLIIFFWVLGP